MNDRANLVRVALTLGIALSAALLVVLVVGTASAQQRIPLPTPPEEPQPTGCDGGKVARRWNMVHLDWERDFCNDLYDAVPTHDPFDAVFGYNHGYYGWDYGQAIQYLLDEGFSAGQLGTYQGQVNALVSLGLWNTTTQSIPAGADLSFLAYRPAEHGPSVIPSLPMW